MSLEEFIPVALKLKGGLDYTLCCVLVFSKKPIEERDNNLGTLLEP